MAENPASYHDFLQSRDKNNRLKILANMRSEGAYLPLTLAEDLLCLDLTADEKLKILETTSSPDALPLEHFFTAHILSPAQEIAATAVRLWAQKTEHLLWHRLVHALKSPHLPQRVFYTIVDHAFEAGGAKVIEVACKADGFLELSPALHGLLLHRAAEWGVEKPELSALAERILRDLALHLHPENKATVSALTYLARFAPSELQTFVSRSATSEPWRDMMRAMVHGITQSDRQIEKLTKLLLKPPKTKLAEKISALWPPLWSRTHLTADIVAEALVHLPTLEATSVAQPFECFAGIPEVTLTAGLGKISDDQKLAEGVGRVFGLLSEPMSKDLGNLLRQKLSATADPAAFLQKLPLRARLELTSLEERGAKTSPGPFSQVKTEAASMLGGGPQILPARFIEDSPSEDLSQIKSRKAFFNLAYRASAERPAKGTSFFDLLADAWYEPRAEKLTSLAQAARQVEGIFRICYLNTLARFRGHDLAALKTLDFIRSKEEDELKAVLHALGGIATPRASQELVSALTRPNMTPSLQLEACAVLQRQDLHNLQAELKSAIKDLTEGGEQETEDVRDAIANLLAPTLATNLPESSNPQMPLSASDLQLDHALSGKIPHYRDLSSEVKRALRTSQFFHLQVMGGGAPESIDLSPVVDMQYKALELLFREMFEEACSLLINRGTLQRRLDVIGYARPIPRAMDEFEAYVASLPVVRDIPFFSKFKLRKMLRAICQFRPGKRFTLDGLKAFALFFLCFSRSECRFGLAGIFPIGLGSDRDLFDFCKALHMHQDIRNRAAHEGFHPDASSDIDGIWRATAEIVQTAFKARQFVDRVAVVDAPPPPKPRAAPIIEKKVS